MARDVDQVTVDSFELVRSIKINVRMPRLFGARLWVAAQLFRFASWVSGMGTVIEIDDEKGARMSEQVERAIAQIEAGDFDEVDPQSAD
jgi:hypothetical protein